MLGLSYGEIFLLLGATAALIGPKDLPIIARTAGRLAGRAIGYVQLARGQFESVMQQSQARQVHKELQDTMAQLEAIRHEIRSISIINPGPMTRRLVDNPDNTAATTSNSVLEKHHEDNRPLDEHIGNIVTGKSHVENEPLNEHTGNVVSGKPCEESRSPAYIPKDHSSVASESRNIHSQATAYARLAESPGLKSLQSSADLDKVINESGLPNVLPISAASAGMLPNRRDDIKGSDIVLEAILEAEVAHNAKEFFAQPQNQIKPE